MSKIIPNIMPYQMEPINGDIFIEKEFIKLRDRFGLTNAIETGTCLGSTTLFLAENFERVFSIECNMEYLTIANDRLKEQGLKNTKTIFGDSSEVLQDIIFENKVGSDTIFFLDAHFYDHCPLVDELNQIAACGIKPVIAIHDFKVPGENKLGFDTYKGQAFEIDWIKSKLKAIYGDSYSYYYNTSKEAAGAMRGIIYIHPNG